MSGEALGPSKHGGARPSKAADARSNRLTHAEFEREATWATRKYIPSSCSASRWLCRLRRRRRSGRLLAGAWAPTRLRCVGAAVRGDRGREGRRVSGACGTRERGSGVPGRRAVCCAGVAAFGAVRGRLACGRGGGPVGGRLRSEKFFLGVRVGLRCRLLSCSQSAHHTRNRSSSSSSVSWWLVARRGREGAREKPPTLASRL